jgi:hypothetical protein
MNVRARSARRRTIINKTATGDREEPLMNFTKGEILKELLRLIASACRSGLLYV